MDIILQNKKAVIGIALLLIAFYAVSLFSTSGSMEEEPSAVETNAAIVEIAGELSGIQFKHDIFSDPGYRSLVDFSAALPQENPGRSNPFAQIGRD